MLSKFYRLTKISLPIFILLFSITATVSSQQKNQTSKPTQSRRISLAEGKRLLEGETEGNLSNQPNKFSRTRLSDGRVIELYYPIVTQARSARKAKTVTVPGYGVLYESEAAFKEDKRPRHMLEDLIPDGRNLISNIPQFVLRLEKRLGLGAGKLDYSRASLRRIDVYISGYQRTHTTAQTDSKLFQELTAYYGETLRRALNGEWNVREERVGDTHIQLEPNITLNSNGKIKEIKPWSSVISALYDEDKRGIGLTKAFDADLRAAQNLPASQTN